MAVISLLQTKMESPSMRLIKETEAHIFLRLLLILNSSGSGLLSSGSGSSRGSRSKLLGVLNAVLEVLGLGNAVVRVDGDSQKVSVTVSDQVGNGSKGGVTSGQRDGSNLGDTRDEVGKQSLLLNVKDGRREAGTLIVDLDKSHTVGEGRDVQHVEQSSFGGTDLGALGDKVDVGDNFNGTTGNLGWDTKSLEERGLTGFHTSVTGRDFDINGSDGTSTSRSSNTVGENLLTDFLEVAVGENETNVTSDERKKTFVLGVLRHVGLEGTTNHGVLTHQDNSFATERLTDLMHLVGTDIVNIDNEDGLVLFKKSLELGEIGFFGFTLRHDNICSRTFNEPLFRWISILDNGWMDGWMVRSIYLSEKRIFPWLATDGSLFFFFGLRL
jgi:hypothetical protein